MNKSTLIIVIPLMLLAFAIGSVFNPSFSIYDIVSKTELKGTPSVEELNIDTLSAQVVPPEGRTIRLAWGDTGAKLVAARGIDMTKYRENYADAKYEDLLSYLTETGHQEITINQDTAYFWVNTLWALGLTQRSDVLNKGIMGTEYKDTLGNFASTGGWTLGATDAVSLYSSSDIIPLTPKQQQRVAGIAANIYRPCCGNSTAFPDCNHGMAILGLVELMVSQELSDEEIYEASLAFNSYWFPQTYIDLAYYFKTKEGVAWSDIDAKRVLSQEFSSAGGYQNIKSQIGTIPGQTIQGGSCGA